MTKSIGTAFYKSAVVLASAALLMAVYSCGGGDDKDEENQPPMENRMNFIQPIPKTVEVNAEKAALGRRLYHDKKLSGDDTVSCATCHVIATGGDDDRRTSVGIEEAVGPINAPTVLNSSFNFVQFWDGRAANLKEQALGPVTNPKEMGANWEDVIAKLGADQSYVDAFAKVYGENSITSDNVADAIAEFEKTLTTPDSKFDKWIQGDDDALSADEVKGYRTFVSTGCVTCHTGVNVGGQMYQKMSAKYFEERGTEITDADLGRFNVTHNESDRHLFKVPSLRNVELTMPYFHDGSVDSIEQAVFKMARYQLSKELSPEDIRLIVLFLKSLTGRIPQIDAD
ncbi:MAG: cytochrome-c peroxidase [Planctomycetes bacterium]|nr:cytochrome-c peroxidase [Planctomycetota bacterium]